MRDSFGSIIEVKTTNVGEFLTADVSVGAVILPVTDAGTFDDAGGYLTLNGIVYPYVGIDPDANTVELGTTVTTAALAEESRVEIWPARPEKRALVDFEIEEGEPVWVIVPHGLADVVADGAREEGFREAVLVEERTTGELYAKDLPAQQDDAWREYTPVFTNHGTATFSTLAGLWRYIAPKLVFVTIYFVVDTAGSGAGALTITLPTNPDRTLRQLIPCHVDGLRSSGFLGVGAIVIFISGSDEVADRIRTQDNGSANDVDNLSGANLLSNGVFTAQGIYREA
jgi:hypothetical protein